MKLSTPEKTIIDYLKTKDKPVYAQSISIHCDIKDFPMDQLLKHMTSRNILMTRKNVTTNTLSYGINPAFLAKEAIELQRADKKNQSTRSSSTSCPIPSK
jgi:hypothetical protein